MEQGHTPRPPKRRITAPVYQSVNPRLPNYIAPEVPLHEVYLMHGESPQAEQTMYNPLLRLLLGLVLLLASILAYLLIWPRLLATVQCSPCVSFAYGVGVLVALIAAGALGFWGVYWTFGFLGEALAQFARHGAVAMVHFVIAMAYLLSGPPLLTDRFSLNPYLEPPDTQFYWWRALLGGLALVVAALEAWFALISLAPFVSLKFTRFLRRIAIWGFIAYLVFRQLQDLSWWPW